MWIKFVFPYLFLNIVYSFSGKLESCRTASGSFEGCITITKCKSLNNLIKSRHFSSKDLDLLRNSFCEYDGIEPTVCCPDKMANIEIESDLGDITSNLLPDTNICGTYTHHRIYGGEKTGLREFPWMVLIKYEASNHRWSFSCGGILISKRYVLTAAHCLKGKGIPKNWNLVSVRLGEYNTNTEPDCIDNGFKPEWNEPTIDVKVEERISHEKYDPDDSNQYHDIALLRLDRNVSFTDFIEPICLPLAREERMKTFENETLTVAGWGTTTDNGSMTNIKLKLEMPVTPQTICTSKYAAELSILEGQLCAGGEKGKDSCRGDSGGPLMAISTDKNGESNWYAAGIVSFGPVPCGKEGLPGVYTRVSKYTSWIVSKLRP